MLLTAQLFQLFIVNFKNGMLFCKLCLRCFVREDKGRNLEGAAEFGLCGVGISPDLSHKPPLVCGAGPWDPGRWFRAVAEDKGCLGFTRIPRGGAVPSAKPSASPDMSLLCHRFRVGAVPEPAGGGDLARP